MNTIYKIISIFILSLTFSHVTHAMSQGLYMGGGIGGSILNDFSDATRQNNEPQLAGRIFLGFNFNQRLGFELSYAKYGETEYTLDDSFDSVTYDYQLNTTSFAAKAYYPFDKAEKLSAYVLFGVTYVNTNADIFFDDTKILDDTSHMYSPTVGAGIRYIVNSHLATNAEYSYANGKNGNSNHLGIPESNLFTWNVAVIL